MLKTIIAILISICSSLNSFGQIQPIGSAEKGFSDEEYKVWSEMNCSLDFYMRDVRLSFIHMDTIPITLSLEKDRDFIPKIRDYYAHAKLADATNDLIRDFNTKNDKSYLLERKFSGCKNYSLMSKDDLSKFNWTDFKKAYPESFIYRFSRIGLSPDKKQAVIYFDYGCGVTCGSGDFYFFVKEEDFWDEKVKVNLSMR